MRLLFRRYAGSNRHGIQPEPDSSTQHLRIDTYTAPAEAPASIDDEEGILASTVAVQRHVACIDLDQYDAVLVACFSVHSLVAQLTFSHPRLAVTGIFEASILSALSLIATGE